MTVSRSNGTPSVWASMIARVRGETAARSWSGIGVVVAEADVDEHRHQAVLDDRRDGARKARGDGDHLVAGLEAAVAELGRGERRERDEVRRRAGVDEQGVRQAEVVGEARLELLGEAAGGQVEVEARVDEGAHLLLAEDAAGVAHRVAVGVERRAARGARGSSGPPARGSRRACRPRRRWLGHVVDLLVVVRPTAGPRRGRRPGRPGADRSTSSRAAAQGPGSTRGTRRPSGARPSARPRPGAHPSCSRALRLSRLQQLGLVRLRLPASAGVVQRAGPPLLQEALDDPAHRSLAGLVVGPEVPRALVATAIAQHAAPPSQR